MAAAGATSRICVKNLGNKVSEQQLRDVFSAKGEVTDVSIVKTADGKTRHFAFVGFRDAEQAAAAKKYFNNTFIGMARIAVDFARQKQPTGAKNVQHGKGSRDRKDTSVLQSNNKKNTPAGDQPKQQGMNDKKSDKTQQTANRKGAGAAATALDEFTALAKRSNSTYAWSNGPDLPAAAVDLPARHIDQRSQSDERGNETEGNENNKITNNINNHGDDKGDVLDVVRSSAVSDLDYLKSKISSKERKMGKKRSDSPSSPIVSTDSSSSDSSSQGSDRESEGESDGESSADDVSDRDRGRERPRKVKSAEDAFDDAADRKKLFDKAEKVVDSKGEEERAELGEGEEMEYEEDADDIARVFVKNLPYTCSEDEVREHFEVFGQVTEVHLPLDAEKKSGKGFGFVTFMFPEHARKSVEASASASAITTITTTAAAEEGGQEGQGTLHSFQGRVLRVTLAESNLKNKKTAAADGGGVVNNNSNNNNNNRLSSFKQKKEEERRKNLNKKDGWNASFVRSDTVIDSLADRFETSRSAILDTNAATGGELAVRLAVGETQIVAENRAFFAAHGVDLSALESAHSSSTSSTSTSRGGNSGKAGANAATSAVQRSTHTILVKNLPHQMVVEELESMFARYGTVAKFLVPKSKSMALVDFVEPSEARAAYKGLAYRSYMHVPLYLEWAPLQAVSDRSKQLLLLGKTKEQQQQQQQQQQQRKSVSEQEKGRERGKSEDRDQDEREEEDAELPDDRHGKKNNHHEGVASGEKALKIVENRDGASHTGTGNAIANNEQPGPAATGVGVGEGEREGEGEGDEYHTLYIKNLNFVTTEASLREHILRVGAGHGLRAVVIQKKRLLSANASANNNGNNQTPVFLSQGYGFAEFSSARDAQRGQKCLQGSLLDSHTLEVKPSEKRLTHRQAAGAAAAATMGAGAAIAGKSRKLIVRNVAFQATKAEIRALFTVFGSVKQVRIPKKMGGEHRGFAFVEFSTTQEAANAMMSLKDTHLYGRHLVLAWSEEDSADAAAIAGAAQGDEAAKGGGGLGFGNSGTGATAATAGCDDGGGGGGGGEIPPLQQSFDKGRGGAAVGTGGNKKKRPRDTHEQQQPLQRLPLALPGMESEQVRKLRKRAAVDQRAIQAHAASAAAAVVTAARAR